MLHPSQQSTAKATVLLLSLLCHPNYSFSDLVDAKLKDGPKVYFYYYSNPYHLSVYKITKGSLTGVQKTFDDHKHDTIAKDEEFTVLVDFSSSLYHQDRKWYEIPARFCYGKDTEGCVKQHNRSFINPYLVRPSSEQIPVPFVVPFSKLHNVTLSDGTTVIDAGTVHEQFKTFEVNGAKYDTSTGILTSFSAESPEKAGKISGVDILRDKGKVLKHQPLVQCHFVEWTADGCVPGLDNIMIAYNVKFLQLKYRAWLKAVKFPEHRDDRYLKTLYIPGIGEKNYLVFKDMALEQSSAIGNPFVYLFASVEEQVNTTLDFIGLRYSKEEYFGSGKYKGFSKHYKQPSYSAAMSGTEFRFFRASMSNSYLRDEANWNDNFKKRWKSLFDQSNKEKAMDFFRDYGTHYVVQAVMGGRQEAVFTVDYCEISKDKGKTLDFETQLIKPYKFMSSANIQDHYRYKASHSLSKTIIWGPQITCTGGNYLDPDVCHNVPLRKASVLNNPYPITMTLKPFYTLPKVYEDSLWLKKMYEEYLKADLDEEKTKSRANCKQPSPGAQPNLSSGAVAGIVFGTFVAFIIILGIVIYIYRQKLNECLVHRALQLITWQIGRDNPN